MIQTRGFQIDNLPRYTPSDPSLVAFQPQRFTNGVMDAYKLSDLFNRIKAFKSQQAELDALRQKRIAATGSEYDTTIAKNAAELPNFGKKALYEGAQLNSLTKLLPKEEQAKTAGLDQTIALSPIETATKTAQLKQEELNAAPVGAATRAGAAAQTAAAKNALAFAPLQKIDTMQTLSDKIMSAKDDKERADALKDADIALKRAEATENAARAGYYDRGGANKAPLSPDKAAKVVIDSLDKMDGLVVQDGRTFQKYLADTRDSKGAIKTANMIGFGAAKLDPVGELYVRQYQQLQQELAQYQGMNHGGPATLGTISNVATPAVAPKANRLRFSSDANGGVQLTPVQ